MTDELQLATRLKGRRTQLRLRQREVAEAVGVKLRTYQRWEAGDSKSAMSHIVALASMLKTTPMGLLGLAPATPSDKELARRVTRLERQVADVLGVLQMIRGLLGDSDSVVRATD